MSILSYLASSRALPEGTFVSRPDKIYGSYREYRASPDYVKRRSTNFASCDSPDPKLFEEDCPVWVYEGNGNSVSVHNYFPFEPCTYAHMPYGSQEDVGAYEEEMINSQRVECQFALPFLYTLGLACSDKVLQQFLCEHLRPGDVAQYYACFACEEAEPRDTRQDVTVDLQDFLDTGGGHFPYGDYAGEARKLFVTLLAPKTGIHNHWIPYEDVFRIFHSRRAERIPCYLIEKYR